MPLLSLALDDIETSNLRSRRRLSNKTHIRSTFTSPRDEIAQSIAGDSATAEDSGDFHKDVLLNMQQMVGGAVGNMSISPNSRDIVLAARRGLFIIDLEANLKVPRFLPQGGTWDVADVQWNPHTYRGEYIVSTSCEKLLIWNLNLPGNSNIEHILSSHYRAITDINWHTTEPNIVSSTGIDSWIWTWDIRDPRKPTFGLSAFNAPGTQVKWNRQNENILASAHGNQILIWDRRKGSLPISKLTAHSSKIYGIDWSHQEPKEIVTCSLDKTIKVWDTSDLTTDGTSDIKAKATIRTTYPVWRARNLPFGRGVLSLAQRGEPNLEMYSNDDSSLPIYSFEGHTDVVKEFVWRRGGPDGNGFQLITWSKDRTLRFWAVDPDIMERVGYTPLPIKDWDPENTISYRTLPHATKNTPLLSAPIGHRSILAEVRAGPAPARPSNSQTTGNQPHLPPPHDIPRPAKMTRGPMSMSKSMARTGAGDIDGLTWLASVKVEDRKRGSGSNPGSDGINSADASRMSSRSRGFDEQERRRSESRSRSGLGAGLEDGKESLQDEIKTVVTKLTSYKVRLEKHELTAKKRFCTIGLHGPWGQTSSVFMRITFTFPKDYPNEGPESIPTINLEQSPLVSINDRARILRKLKTIRETRRPCLEACLRYLLFKNEDVDDKPMPTDSESSDEEDDEEDEAKRREREFTLALLRNNKNLAEPRTSQGSFGPNGELIRFSRAPPRIVRMIRGLSESPKKLSSPPTPEQKPRTDLYQSPSLAAEAVRRLELAAVDTPATLHRRAESQLTRLMTNFLTFSQQRFRRGFESDISNKDRFVGPLSRSTVLLTNTSIIAGADRKAANGYIFSVRDADGDLDISTLCERNAEAAVRCKRYDHGRIFVTLRSLLSFVGQDGDSFGKHSLVLWKLIKRLMTELGLQKDVQLLGMVAMTVLQAIPPLGLSGSRPQALKSPGRMGSFRTGYSDSLGLDYFSLNKSGHTPLALHLRSRSERQSPQSPMWPRLPSTSTTPPPVPGPSSSNSSRTGSWSSLFTTNHMRQFVADKLTGVQDSFKDGLMTPIESSRAPTISGSIPIPAAHKIREPLSPQPQRRSGGRDSLVSKSWNEDNRRSSIVSFSPSSKSIVSTVTATTTPHTSIAPRKKIVFHPPEHVVPPTLPFDNNEIQQYLLYVNAYAEVLFRWELHQKRLELLKAVHHHVRQTDGPHQIGVIRMCSACGSALPVNSTEIICPKCAHPTSMPNCSVCRLPVKGLSQSCARCLHVVHISCTRKMSTAKCASGCGCTCRWR